MMVNNATLEILAILQTAVIVPTIVLELQKVATKLL